MRTINGICLFLTAVLVAILVGYSITKHNINIYLEYENSKLLSENRKLKGVLQDPRNNGFLCVKSFKRLK